MDILVISLILIVRVNDEGFHSTVWSQSDLESSYSSPLSFLRDSYTVTVFEYKPIQSYM